MGFFSLKMCLLPLPFVETFFSAAGADLYLVFLRRAERRWISCLLCLPPPPPPPLLCWAAAEVVAKAAGGGGAERAVQLLHRISPCPPFFHMEEDVLRHTLQKRRGEKMDCNDCPDSGESVGGSYPQYTAVLAFI